MEDAGCAIGVFQQKKSWNGWVLPHDTLQHIHRHRHRHTHTHTHTNTHTHTIGNPRKYLFYNHINFQAALYKHNISCPSSFDSN